MGSGAAPSRRLYAIDPGKWNLPCAKLSGPPGENSPGGPVFALCKAAWIKEGRGPSLPAYLRRIPAVLRWLELDARFSSSSTALDAFLLEEEKDFLPDDERPLPEAFAA